MSDIKIHPGSKFFKYKEDEIPEIIRISNVDKENRVSSLRYGEKGNLIRMKRMDLKYLLDNYKMLQPDGIIIASIVNQPQIKGMKDTIIALKRLDDLNNTLPYAICRQCINDFFTEINEPDYTHVGVSVSRDTCPANVNFEYLLACNGIIYSKPIAVYLDDKLEDILRFCQVSKFNKALEETKEISLKMNPLVMGYFDTLEELLKYNNFMYDFRECFGIKEVPFHIEDGAEVLDRANTDFLSHELNLKINTAYIIEYTKEIDLKSIKRKYKLITSAADNYEKVYIAGFDIEM